MNEVARIHEGEISAPTTPMEMIDRALANNSGVEVIAKLMDLQERWEKNEGRKAFDRSIAEAKADIPPIIKNRTVDFTSAKGRTNYAHEDLAQIAKTVDPILAKHGLSYRYRTHQDGQRVIVTCVLSHRDGYSEETTLETGADQSGNKNHIQAVGSAVTYLQRYTLKAALGLAASNDDDGAKADKATITADQFRTLRAKLEQADADEDKFLKFLGVENLETLPSAMFGKADAALDRKIGGGNA